MLLLACLGNPGPEYAKTRHNAGFLAGGAIARAYGFSSPARKFKGEWSEGNVGGEKALLLMPMTYMNRSGESVAEAARFYKIPPEQVVVFYDELDLPLGRIRVKKGGGNGGHNGLRSIDAHLGTEYWRVRIGIGHPGDKARVTGYVLGNFMPQEREVMDQVTEALAAELPGFAARGAEYFASRVASRLQPPKESGTP